MLLSIYIVLSSLCAVLVNKRLRLDPFIIIIPCSLLALDDVTTLLSLFVSLMPFALTYAGYCVFKERQSLNIESVTRLGAGLSLGSFVGVQLVFLLPWGFVGLLSLLSLITLVNFMWWHWSKLDMQRIPQRLSIIVGLLIGLPQSLGLSSGMPILSGLNQHTNSANRCALWCFSLIGAWVGILALPAGMAFDYLSPLIAIAGLVGLLLGLLLSQRIHVSQFESKVLDWIVLAMCLSVWAHLIFKHIIFST